MSRARLWPFVVALGASILAPACDDGGSGNGDGSCVPGCEGGACAAGQWSTICAGDFMMGSPEDEPGRGDDETRHEVTLTHDFAILATEVTQSEFEGRMGYNPSSLSDCPSCPVGNVAWDAAAAYCNRLSEEEGLVSCYSCVGGGSSWTCEPSSTFRSPYACTGYRLPTEAEWEHAARAGTTGAIYGGDVEQIAWCFESSSDQAQPVAGLQANPWGLSDMLGNIAEWCHDWYDAYSDDSVTDPWGPSTGSERIHRGGSYDTRCDRIRTAARGRLDPSLTPQRTGVRPVRTLRL